MVCVSSNTLFLYIRGGRIRSLPGNILIPLNLKIREKPIKTGQRETRPGLKLRLIAHKILICLSLHNGTQSKQFYSKYL